MRKKKRTKAQKAATAKMIRANKARSKGKRRKGKRNPLLVSASKGGKLRTKTVRKGARTSSAKKAKSRSGKKKGHSKKKGHAKKKSKSSKRSLAAKKAARTRKRNKAERSARAKKAARSRKRKGGSKKKGSRKKGHAKKRASTKSRKSAKRSRAAKKAARTRARRKREHETSDIPNAAYESRRRGKRRGKKNPLPIANPIPLEGGLDFFSGLFAVVIGYLFAGGADRMGATHALTASTAQGGFVDAPAVGQIYDSEAPQTPIWSSGMRIAFNVIPIAVPMGISAMIKSRGPKAFFQLMAFAAIARTLGKAAEDGMSVALKNTGFGLRVYGAELAAQAKLTSAATAALPNAAPATFAGVRQQPAALSGAPVQSQQKQPNLPAQNNAPPPAPSFAPPAQQIAGAPTPSLDNTSRFVSGPAFNPFAATDS